MSQASPQQTPKSQPELLVRSSSSKLPVDQYIEQAMAQTVARLDTLGLNTEALLDPEDAIEKQVAILRFHYLRNEKLACGFKLSETRHWQLLRAGLQPLVLAYLTHEKYVQAALSTHLALTSVDAGNSSESGSETHCDLDHILQTQSNVIAKLNDDLQASLNREQQFQEQILDLETAAKKQKKQQAAIQEALDALQAQSAVSQAQSAETVQNVEKVTALEEKPKQIAASSGDDNPSLEVEALRERVAALQQDLESTSVAAYEAYMANADQSIVTLFLLSAFKATNFDQLVSDINQCLTNYGVFSIVRLKLHAVPDYFSQGRISDKDKKLFAYHEKKGRYYQFSDNCLFYSGRIALLVKDMPIDNEQHFTRLRDNINTLMKGAELAVGAIERGASTSQ